MRNKYYFVNILLCCTLQAKPKKIIMNKTRAVLDACLLYCFKKNIFTSILFCFFILLFCISSNGQNTKSAQWASAGGEIILSGNHNFTTSWASHAYSRQDGNKWWQGGFWGKREPLIPWENTVLNSVAPNKGEITVLGPCNIGLYQKAKGPRIQMIDTEPKAAFTPWTNTISFSGQVWSGTVNEFNESGEFWGYIPADKEITLEISAVMSVYNNQGGTGEISYNAPQEIEYEIWFFPRGDGCKVISVTQSSGGFEKPQPGIIYYTDKDCN